MKTTRLVLHSIGFGVLVSCAAPGQQSPPNPSNTTFVNAPQVFSAPLRVCSTDGYLSGLVCLPQGSEYSCGNQITITQGTEVELSASVNIPGGAGSIGVSATYSFSQAVTHTAGMCERCQQYVCYPNSTLEHWSCE